MSNDANDATTLLPGAGMIRHVESKKGAQAGHVLVVDCAEGASAEAVRDLRDCLRGFIQAMDIGLGEPQDPVGARIEIPIAGYAQAMRAERALKQLLMANDIRLDQSGNVEDRVL